MIDEMQSEYKKYVDSRMEPSEEFLDRLTKTLREEAEQGGMSADVHSFADGQELTSGRNLTDVRNRAAKSVGFSGKRSFLPYFAAAAVLALAVGITAFSYWGLSQKSQAEEEVPATEGTLSQYAGEADGKSGQGSVIGNPGWWDDGLTAESLPKALAQKMGAALEQLSSSGDNKFVDAEQETAREAERIAELLGEAVVTEEKITAADISAENTSVKTVYYMAVFSDGTIAKFRIADERFLVISGEETVYEIK